jgi:hypothetical protein
MHLCMYICTHIYVCTGYTHVCMYEYIHICNCRDSVVGIGTFQGWMARESNPGWWGGHFPHLSRLGLAPIQAPVPFPGIKRHRYGINQPPV